MASHAWDGVPAFPAADRPDEAVVLFGGEANGVVLGQAQQAVALDRPAPGETIAVETAPGAVYLLDFAPDAASVTVDGDDIVMTFDGDGDGTADSRIVFLGLAGMAGTPDAPGLVIAGVDYGVGALLDGTDTPLTESDRPQGTAPGQQPAGNPAGPPVETAGGPETGARGGTSSYQDDFGQLVAGLNAAPSGDPGTVIATLPRPAAEGNSNEDNANEVEVQAADGTNTITQTGTATTQTATATTANPIDLTSLSPSAGFIIQGDVADDRAGFSVSSAGDVNGDGFDDLIVGARYGDDGGGEAYVVFGKASGFGTADDDGRRVIDLTGLSSDDGFIIQGDTGGDQAGFSVSSAGDVNGDGFDDLIVGAPYGDDGGGEAGEAYVVFGSDDADRQVIDLESLSDAEGFIIQGDTDGDRAGWSVSSAGDVNGDGFDDLIVGAPYGDDGGSALVGDAGEAYVVFGKASDFGEVGESEDRRVIDLTGLSTAEGFIIQGDTAGDRAGSSVSSAGDVNGDGFDDLIVGAPYGDDGGSSAGEAYVVFGKDSDFGEAVDAGRVVNLNGLSSDDGFIIQGDTGATGGVYAGDFAGWSVSSAGDVNGDGFDDLIVGARGGDDGGTDAGEAYVVFGKESDFGEADGGRQVIDLTDLSSDDGFIIRGDAEGDQAGFSVSSAGDVNGDGFDDLIVGARYGDDGGDNAGEAYVVFGKASGFGTLDGDRRVIDLTDLSAGDGFITSSDDGFIIQGDADGDQAGRSVSAAGDVNDDGFDDLIVGAPRGDDGGTDAGEGYVIFGGAFGGSTSPVTTTGTAAAEVLIGAAGADTLTGGGGADVFRAGAGDDTLVVSNTDFKRIDGGSGDDTLRLDGAGLSLDFTTIRPSIVKSIETIDLTGSGNNTLTLNIHDLLDMSDDTADGVTTLTVRGNTGDAVVIAGSGWNGNGTTPVGGVTFDRFDNGSARLLVDPDVDVTGGGIV